MTEPKKQTIFDIADIQEDPGPKMGLGGWGLPGINSPEGATPDVGPILGYCLEKISSQFGALRGLSQEGQSLMQNLRLPQTQSAGGLRGGKKTSPPTRKEKLALEAKTSVLELLAQENVDPIELQALLEKMLHLQHNDKKEFLAQLPKDLNEHLIEISLLTVLRTATSKEDFLELQEAIGGDAVINELTHDTYYGSYQCLLENHEIVPWVPPFHHPLFQANNNEQKDHAEIKVSLEGLQAQFTPDAPPIIKDDYMQRFMIGDITASDLMGLSRDELYMIATRGYSLLQEGKLSQALNVFDGLVYLDPYDPYFYTVLGSIRQRQEDTEGAITCFNQAIRLQPWNINALANRGEILFNQGKLIEAMEDFQRVIAFDAEDKNPSTLRVKTLVLALGEALEKKTNSSNQTDDE